MCDLLNITRMNQAKNDTRSRLMAWGDGNMSDDHLVSLSSAIAVQTHIWKIAAALKLVLLFNRSFSGTASSTSTYNFILCKSTSITDCVPMTYVLLI